MSGEGASPMSVSKRCTKTTPRTTTASPARIANQNAHRQQSIGLDWALFAHLVRHLPQVIRLDREILKLAEIVEQQLQELNQLAHLALGVQAGEKLDEVPQLLAALTQLMEILCGR